MNNKEKIFLPNFKKYNGYLRKIWHNGQIANNGPLVRELEDKLRGYLGVKHLFLVNNGTTALQLAIKALDLQGEIITSPLSFVATPSAISWQGCKPVFVDIDEKRLTIDPKKIIAKITPKTEAIIPVHIFGYPCKAKGISEIAKKFKLKVIYDGSHAFGVKCKGKSIFDFGDISTVSFNETKLFHTAEGGAIITNDDEIAEKIKQLRYFGLSEERKFVSLGINAKNSELNAAMGLAIFPEIKKIIKKKKNLKRSYDKLLSIAGIKKPELLNNTEYNFAYYPVIFPSEETLLKVLGQLQKNNIFPERFFYPALSRLSFFERQNCPIAEDLAERIICLPLYYSLTQKNIQEICRIIKAELLDERK
jgi:dTDP-4-amino-4,6-dideoxygalactose transaminase